MLLRDLGNLRKSLELASEEQVGLQDFNNAHKKLNHTGVMSKNFTIGPKLEA